MCVSLKLAAFTCAAAAAATHILFSILCSGRANPSAHDKDLSACGCMLAVRCYHYCSFSDWRCQRNERGATSIVTEKSKIANTQTLNVELRNWSSSEEKQPCASQPVCVSNQLNKSKDCNVNDSGNGDDDLQTLPIDCHKSPLFFINWEGGAQMKSAPPPTLFLFQMPRSRECFDSNCC